MKTKFNLELLLKQKVSKEQLQELEHIYSFLENIMKVAKILQKNNDLTNTTGSIISNTIRDIEFILQKNWNFPQNEAYHNYQFKLPGCTCPKLDNADRLGSGSFVISGDCPYHSKSFSNIRGTSHEA